MMVCEVPARKAVHGAHATLSGLEAPGFVGAMGASPGLADDVAAMSDAVFGVNSPDVWQLGSTELGCHLAWRGRIGKHSEPCAWMEGEDSGVLLVGEATLHSAANAHRVSGGDLVSMYRAKGLAFLDQLSGHFAGVVIDRAKGTVVLFNDRHGLQRVYFRQSGGAFHFSSQARGLLRIFADSRALDPGSVAEVHSVGCVMGGRSLFRGIEVLPPSTCVEVLGGGAAVRRSQYFSPSVWESQQQLGMGDFHDALRGTLSRIIPRHIRADHRVGMSLTGGLDGRLIMAWAGAPPASLHCYSFGGMYRKCHDVRLAQKIAATCQQRHQTIEVGREFLGRFPSLALAAIRAADGAMDVSGAVEVYVNDKARNIAPVRITGNYGSEIMRGNVAFRPRNGASDHIQPEFASHVRAAAQTYETETSGSALSFISFRQVPWHHYARFAVERSQIAMRNPFLDAELVSLMYRSPVPLPQLLDTTLRLIHDGNPVLARIPTDRGLVHGKRTSAVRLRNALREFSAKAEYAYDYGMPQRLAKLDRWLRPVQPERLFLGRHKFYHFRVWYRDALSDYVRDTLLTPRALARSYFRPEALRSMVEAHTTGRGNYTLQIHQALTFELIHQELLQ